MKRIGIFICMISAVPAYGAVEMGLDAHFYAEPPKSTSNYRPSIAQPEPGEPTCVPRYPGDCGGGSPPPYNPPPYNPPPYNPPPPPPQPSAEEIARQWNNAGVAAYDSNNWADARAKFQQALNYNPLDTVIRGNLAKANAQLANAEGNAAFNREDWKDAITKYREALGYHSSLGFISGNLANAEAHNAWSAGNFEEALNKAQQIRRLGGANAQRLIRDIARDWSWRIDARLSGIPRDKQLIIKQLGAMKTQFQSISNDYAGITAEALSAQEQAITQYNNMMTEVSDALINEFLVLPEDEWSRREEEHIEKTLERVKEYRDVRKAKLPEIKAIVDRVRNEIKVAVKNTRDPNERNKIAKDIVAKMLNNDLVILKDGDALAEAVKTSIKDDQPPASESILQERINKAWPAVIAASKIAAAHAPEMLGALGRTAGILSYAPELASAVDRATEAYFILPAVVERMDRTQADAERDRQRMAARLRSLISEEQTLHQQRQLARQAMAG